MIGNALQWVAIIVEFLGLTLIAIELYTPTLSRRFKTMLDMSDSDNDDPLASAYRLRSLLRWVGMYILTWIVIVAVLTIQDTAYSVIANVALTIVTILILTSIWISRLLVRAGVALGRGNSVGGVGLVLAVIGFSIEISQFILS